TGAALLWALALGPPSASALETTAPTPSAPKATADSEQGSQRQGGDRPNTAPKNGSARQPNQKSKKEETPPREKSKKEATPPAYKLLRYEEDYSYFYRKSNLRPDFWDPIKFIPLWWVDPNYLSLGGEVRERYEFYHNQDAGLPPANAQGNNADL